MEGNKRVHLRDRIEDIIAEGATQTRIAREIGMSASAVNQWLKEAYKGDNEALEAKLTAWADRRDQIAGLKVPDEPAWVQTPTAERITGAFFYAQSMHDIGLVHGAAGVGKTRTAKHYAETNPNVWIVTMDPSSGQVFGAISEIAGTLGISDKGGGAVAMRRDIVRRLERTNGLLIIDEAQNLDPNALEAVRRIYDEAGIGLVLMGNEAVYGRMTGGRTRGAEFARLWSRVGVRQHVSGIEIGDPEAILDAWGIKGEKERELLSRIANNTDGWLRQMTRVLKLALMTARQEGQALKVRHINNAMQQQGVTL